MTRARRAPMITKQRVLGVAALVFAVPFAVVGWVVVLAVAVAAISIGAYYLAPDLGVDTEGNWLILSLLALYYVGPVALVLAIPTLALGIPWLVMQTRRGRRWGERGESPTLTMSVIRTP